MYIVYDDDDDDDDDDMFISMLSFIHTWIDRKIDGLIDNDVCMYGWIDEGNKSMDKQIDFETI